MHDTTHPPDDPDELDWKPVNPKALMIEGLLRRCPLCFNLVLDLDRDAHLEAAHPATVTAVVRLAEPPQPQPAAA